MATYGSGPQGGSALISPAYNKNIIIKSITLGTNAPQTFTRVCGPHRIFMTFAGATWSFALTGGTNRVASEVRPMFPNQNEAYDQNIQYVINGSDLPPMGCTILSVPTPPGSTSSRINLFNVVESVTGANLAFQLAYCPFANIDSTITYTGPLLFVNVDMKIIYYRTPPNNRTLGYKISFGSPDYFVRNYPTHFNSVAGVNPLDDYLPHEFERVSGQQTIVVKNDTTGFYFSFDVDYGIIDGWGYIGYITPTANASLVSGPVNATITITSRSDVNSLILFEDYTLTALDGRVYNFVFDPISPAGRGVAARRPTIQLVPPSPVLGINDVTVNVFTRFFKTI